MKLLSKFYRILLYLMPILLFFSYYPVISLGEKESMNLELSLPLILLVLFDIVVAILMVRRKKVREVRQKWYYILFPIFASLSILWSDNILRGVLTAGIIWAVFIAVFLMICLRDELSSSERRMAWLGFMVASVAVCGWVVTQCIMDVMGVSREHTLLCAGCVSETFGFPHPNGLAIEPQFMGNLLLMPVLAMAYMVFCQRSKDKGCLRVLLLFVFASTLFLTFSRGAIYAGIVGMLFMSGWFLAKKESWKEKLKRAGTVWLVVVLSFGLTLNLQGIMAELGPTNDTYGVAVAKAVHHLSLGVIDFRAKDSQAAGIVENEGPLEERDEMVEMPSSEAVFDGYVAESTEVRKQMTRNALKVWSSSPRNILVGVGLGGAGEAMYEAGLIDSPKEIVQNQYVSLLLELGIVGVAILLILSVMAGREVWKRKAQVNLLVASLVVAYGVSLLFFAGLPNALQVYLMPAWIWIVLKK